MAGSSKMWAGKAATSGRCRARVSASPDGLDDLANLGPVEVRGRLWRPRKRSSRSLSASSISRPRRLRVGFAHRLGAREEALEQQIVLEQAAPAAPAQLAQRALVDRAAGVGRAVGVGVPAARSRRAPRHRPSDGAPHHQLLDLADGAGRVELLRTDVDAVHDRVAAEQAVRVLEVVEPLVGRLVAAVGDEPVGLQQPGRADELVGVPPEARAGGRAARAEDALVEAIELVALLGRLQALLLGRPLRR